MVHRQSKKKGSKIAWGLIMPTGVYAGSIQIPIPDWKKLNSCSGVIAIIVTIFEQD